MNDNDLERRLRAETGPREQGYVEHQLPASLERPMSASRPSRALRLAVLVPAIAGGILVVAVAGALLTNNAPGGIGSGPTSTPTPTATARPPSQPVACQPADLELTAEPWGGAAGSRGTVVASALAEGRYPCTLQRWVDAKMVDRDGNMLVAANVPRINHPILVNPTDVLTMGVSWSNWCGPAIAEPIALVLSSAGSTFPVPVPAGADPVPPCLGENQTPVLNVTGFQPAE